MDAKRLVRSCVSFYGMFAASALAVSFVCGLIMFMYRMKRLAELSLAHKGRMEQTYEEHMAILDCMKNGDTSHIYEITLKHMETPRDINLEDL